MTLPTFDTSVLSAYYASGASLKPSTLALKLESEGLTRRGEPGVLPPWLQSDPAANDENALQRIFSSDKLIDTDDPLVRFNGGNETYEKLFALHRALSHMRELVDYAQNGARADSMRGLLDNRFQRQLGEIHDYVAELELGGGLTLTSTVPQSALESTVFTPKYLADALPRYVGGVVSTVREDPVAGLTGTERFTITVETSTGTTNIDIDLSQVSGTLNLDNIAAYINDQLGANGVLTKFAVERFHETAYGLRIEGVAAENLTFTPDPSTQSASVYIAGSSGGGDYANGFLRKLGDLDAAAPDAAFRSNIDSGAADQASAVAVDGAGNVYVVGTAGGDLEGQVNQDSPDAYLQKFDAAGNLVWSRLLGSATDAAGFSVAVDADGNVVIAGQTRDRLTATAYGGGYDGFVTKYDQDGRELWTRQAAPYADDAALSVTVDASGNIFLAGHTRSAIAAGTTHAGGLDGYVTKLDASGATVWNKQFGGTGNDRATAIAVDNAGSVYVAGEEDGHAVLRKYTDGDLTQSPVWEMDVGALGAEGTVTGVAVGGNGAVYLTGSTTNAALSGTIAQAHSGGRDGFVTRIVDNGASASVDVTSYVGSAGSDEIRGIAVRSDGAGDQIFLTGSTTGSIAGQPQSGETDGFVVKLDQAGTTVWADQFGSAMAHSGNGIAFDADGTSVVSRLGLPAGPTLPAQVMEVANLTSARTGMSFSIAVDGDNARRVTLEEGDSFGMLVFRINRVLGKDGIARIEDEPEGRRLVIEARNGSRIDILSGPEGFDALAPLGLQEVTLYAEAAEQDDIEASEEDEEAEQTLYSLGLFDGLSVEDAQHSTEAGLILDNAMREIRDLYERLSGQSDVEDPLAGVTISAEAQARINQLSFALERVSLLAQQVTPIISIDA